MKINMGGWKEFEVRDLFDVVYGVNLELVNCTETTKDDPEAVAFVSRTESNNGVSAYVKPVHGIDPQPKNTITVAGGGSVLSTFLQTQPFYSGRDLYLLYSKEEISHKAKLFIVTIIKANKYRYNYGRQANTSLPYLRLRLPVLVNGKPDWEWMESYVDSLHSEPLKTKNKSNNKNIRLNVCEWGEFQLDELFDVVYGVNLEYVNCIETDSRDPEGIAFVSRTKSNNGVSGFVKPVLDIDPQERGLLTVAGGGSVLETFLQAQEFYSGRDLYLLYPKEKISLEAKLFIATIIKANKYRYNYGRQANVTLPYLKLRLPVTLTGNPDWEYMEKYIKSLPYGDRIRQ